MKILLFVLFFAFLNASEYPDFSKKELEGICKKSGSISKNRIIDYIDTVASFKKLPKQKQLLKVNTYLNQLLPQYDEVVQHTEDYWATPKEFLSIGYGDCEDYVIIKYFTLLKLGFDKEKLFMTTVNEAYTGGYHMVLSYFESKDKPPLILDNLSFRVLDLKKRRDLKADLFLNAHGTYKLDNYTKLKRVGMVSEKFKRLLEKIKREEL